MNGELTMQHRVPVRLRYPEIVLVQRKQSFLARFSLNGVGCIGPILLPVPTGRTGGYEKVFKTFVDAGITWLFCHIKYVALYEEDKFTDCGGL